MNVAKIVRYNKKRHFDLLQVMLRSRDLKVDYADTVPKLGLLAFYNETPVAAGFLRRVEGHYAILDSLITDPTAAPQVRDKILDLLVTMLIGLAKRHKIKGLQAGTLDSRTLVRALRHGFVQHTHTLITLDLSI